MRGSFLGLTDEGNSNLIERAFSGIFQGGHWVVRWSFQVVKGGQMTEMSQRAFARHMGVALNAVQKALKSGRISLNDNGKIDAETAVAAWRRNTDESRRSFTDLSRSTLALDDDALAPTADPDDAFSAAAPAGDVHMVAYRASRADREATRAQRERMELERELGNLLPLSDANRLAFTAFRTLRDSIMNVPVRIKDLLAAEGNPTAVEMMLEDELARALTSIDVQKFMHEEDVEEDDGGDRQFSEDDGSDRQLSEDDRGGDPA